MTDVIKTSERVTAESNPVEAAAREYCARLLTSRAAQVLPKDSREALVIVAFSLGAAWALNRPDMIELADAQMDSMRAQRDGRTS